MTVALAISPTTCSGLVFHSAILGGMNGRRFDDFRAQTRLNLVPDEHVIFIFDGAPAHRNPAIPGPNSELRKLPPYSPFLNIVEQAVSSLKAADISRPEIQVQMNDRAEARRQGLALGNSPHAIVTSSTTEEYWYHHCRQMWIVVQVYADVLTKMHQYRSNRRIIALN